MILAESPRRQRVTKLVNWGHWFALVNIAIALTIASVFIFASPLPDTVLGTAYLIANWLGHISFMTFFGFVIFVLPLCYLVNNPRTIKASASVIAAVGLALLAFDALLYNRTGFHISISSANLIKNEAQPMNQFTLRDWGFLGLLFIVWLGFQLILANAIWKRIARLQQHHIGTPVSSFFVLCFVSSHAIHVWADAQLYQPIIQQDNMFPLSYPATAKTTMSRYGLLDLARYEERKQLQFDPDIHKIRYPVNPVYCSVDKSKNLTLIVQTDAAPMPDLSAFDLRATDRYFSTASSMQGLVMTTLFGVPEIYEETLESKTPLMVALPAALGMPVSITTDEALPGSELEQFRTSKGEATRGLHIAFLTAREIGAYVNSDLLASHSVIIAGGFDPQAGDDEGILYSNLPLQKSLSSTEDLAPTVLGALGCSAPIWYYATGQNLLEPKRNWFVSTSGEKVLVFQDNKRIEVLSNGSYEITDIETGHRSNEKLNVDLLSRAIKHLTRFSTAQ